MISFDLELFKKLSFEIFNVDSPTGYTSKVIKLIESYIKELGYNYQIKNNGALEVSIKGNSSKLTALLQQ